MFVEEAIIEYVNELFDVVGVAMDNTSNDRIMIVGLVTTPERDLDEFVHERGKSIMRGFILHAKERQDRLLAFIRSKNFSAELIGKLGYPLFGQLNLKHLAVSAGLGLQGKNTLVINPQYGPWLRFMTVRTDAPVALTGSGMYSKEENPYCRDCDRCLKACPVSILEPYQLLDANRCLAAISEDRCAELAICDKCVVACPVGQRKSRID